MHSRMVNERGEAGKAKPEVIHIQVADGPSAEPDFLEDLPKSMHYERAARKRKGDSRRTEGTGRQIS